MRAIQHIFGLSIILLFTLSLHAQKKSKKGLTYKEKQKFERLFIDASKAKILSDFEQSIKLFESCVKIDPSQPTPHYELGNLYFHVGAIDQAIKHSKIAAETDPENVYFRIMYAEVLKGSQNYEAAKKQYEGIIEDFPNRFEIYAEWALLEILQKEYDKAIDIYDRLELTMGPNEEIKLKKQYLYLQTGKVDKAAAEIEELIQLQPENVKYYLLLAEVYYINGFEDKALKAYKKAENKFPNNADIQLSLADFYKHKKQYKKVFAQLNIAFQNQDLDIDTKMKSILEMFDVVSAESQYRENLRELGKVLLEAHPNDAKALTINGDIALNMDLKTEAQSYFELAVEKDKSRFPIWNQLLILDAELELNEKLKEHSQEASELFPNQPLCFYFLGFANGMLDENRSAIEAYEKGLLVTVDNDLLLIQFYLSLGEQYNTIQDFEKSDYAFEQLLKLDSNNTIALNNYSYYLSLRNEKLEKALYFSGKSNELEPNRPTYLDTYAWILYKMKRYDEALIFMQKAIDHGGNNSGEVLEHMGDILFKLERKEQAIKYWKEAKEIGGGSEYLIKKLEEGKLYE